MAEFANGARSSRYVTTLAKGGTQLTNYTVAGPPFSKETIVTSYRGTREAMTCMGIHIHPLGGQTCVLEGADATVFVDGVTAPSVYKAGECYYMPPNKYMTSCNLGQTDSMLIDMLYGGAGFDTKVCQPGWSEVCSGRKCWETQGS
jgi:hypothetical protein